MSIKHTVRKRYLGATLSPKGENQEKLINALMNTDNDLIIVGTVGTGKTHTISAFINEIVKNGVYAKYITEYDFADLFTTRHSRDSDVARESNLEIHHCKNYKVVVIDEVGKRELTPNQNIELDELISARYDNMLRTIIVSNLTPAEIKARIKDRAYDRLKGNNAPVIVVEGDSLRH